MSSYLDELNDVQRQAVTTIEGPILVIAGPGSGKTRVLTYRISHLIESGVAPWEILALTFTNKSAREMKERISKVVGDRAQRVWAGTFHSIFARILRVEATKLGYTSNFTIYDTDDSKSVINGILKELNLDPKVYHVNGVRAKISSAKSNIISPRAYRLDESLLLQDRMDRRPMFVDIYEKYMSRCRKAGAMDFDDLLLQLYILLRTNPDNVLQKYQQKFKYVLVDEFQDTNFLQYAILKKLVRYEGSQENLCAVGDDAQSIYGFRGATIDNILDFEKDFKTLKTFKLEQNYRSTDHIVQAANEIIANNKKQIVKKIWSDKGVGQKIKVIKAMADTEEGKRIGDTILEQKNRYHLKNSEIAILYRTNGQSRIFEEYLRRYNLAYRVYGGLSFYQRKEIKDLIAYLRITINHNDEEALKRVINYPKRGLGKASIDKITLHAASADISSWEALNQVSLSARANNSITSFRKMIAVFREKAAKSDAYETALYIAKQSGLHKLLNSDTSVEGIGRVDNMNALLDGIKDFVENDELIDDATMPDKSLASYLQSIALHTDIDKDEENTEVITLMSVHSAKGLEFKSVFVVGLEEGLFPSNMAKDSEEGVDEERRLFYVAITRAQEYLTLSFANSRYRFGKMIYNDPSRFFDEISIQHLDSTAAFRKGKMAEPDIRSSSGPQRAKVVGSFRNGTAPKPKFAIDPKNFKPSPSESIEAGMNIMHLKFGEGKVVGIDGPPENRIATILFKDIGNVEKRIMLRLAKLQILT